MLPENSAYIEDIAAGVLNTAKVTGVLATDSTTGDLHDGFVGGLS